MLGQYLVKYHSRPFYIDIVCFSLIKKIKGKSVKNSVSMVKNLVCFVLNSVWLVK